MPSLRERVERIIDAAPPDAGLIVVDGSEPKKLRKLAERDPAPGGSAQIVVLDLPDPERVSEESRNRTRRGHGPRRAEAGGGAGIGAITQPG